MTAPVQEPTPGREVSGLGYGSRQLFRRPAPVAGEATIPGFHGYKNTNTTCTTGVAERINWDLWTIDDLTVFDAGTVSGGDLQDIELLMEGWYSLSCWAQWSTAPTTGFSGIQMIHDDSDISEPTNAMGFTYPLNFTQAPALKYADIRCFPIDFTQAQSFAFVDRLEFWVVHNHGSNRTLQNAYCQIAYLGLRPPGPFFS